MKSNLGVLTSFFESLWTFFFLNTDFVNKKTPPVICKKAAPSLNSVIAWLCARGPDEHFLTEIP